jgi:hypothetical protein
MFNPSDDTAPRLDELQRIADNTRFILDVKACAKRADELIGLTIAANEAKTAADQAQAALAARVAELDKREAAIREAELAVHTEKQLVKGQRAELSNHAQHLGKIEDQIKMRLLHHAGVLHNFNPALQSMPEWAAVDRELGAGDAHYDDGASTGRPETLDESEPAPNRVAGSTLTHRSPRPRQSSRAEH